jgi:hypothetical protein
LKLACCRAGSALVQRHHQFNIIIMIFIEGVRGRRAGEQASRGEREASFPEGGRGCKLELDTALSLSHTLVEAPE